MKTNQLSLTEDNWHTRIEDICINANLFLLFISPEFSQRDKVLKALSLKFPEAIITGCSTAGEISDVTVKDNTISLTAIELEKTTLKKLHLKLRIKTVAKKQEQI